MMVAATSGWDIANYIFGAIAMIGPFTILWWFLSAARRRFRDLNESARQQDQ